MSTLMKQPIGASPGRLSLAFAAVLSVMALAMPQNASAATGAGATIHNAVTVSYTSGTNTVQNTASVDVTVTTLAAAPTITVANAAQTTTAGGTVTYTFTVRSNSNGPDTYTPQTPTSTDANVSPPTLTTPAAVTLWGGIALGSGNGTITIPAGSETGLTVGAKVEIGAGQRQTYTVSAITKGTPASTTGNTTTPETPTTLTLTPIAGPAITAGSVAAGTQIGEYQTTTLQVTAGTPTTPGTDGTHVVNFNVVTTATDLAGNTITTAAPTTTTTVSSPNLTITKQVRNVSQGGAFASTGVTGKPGEVLEYKITVTNTHATASATAVSISDALSSYVALKTGAYNGGLSEVSISTNGGAPTYATSAADNDVATLNGNTLTVNLGTGATSTTGGTMAAGDQIVVLYQVTVQ